MSQNTFTLKDLMKKNANKTNEETVLHSNEQIDPILNEAPVLNEEAIKEKKVIHDQQPVRQRVLKETVKDVVKETVDPLINVDISDDSAVVVAPVKKDVFIPIENIEIKPKNENEHNKVNDNISSISDNENRSLNSYLKVNNTNEPVIKPNNTNNINYRESDKKADKLKINVNEKMYFNDDELVNKKDNVLLANIVIITITLGFAVFSYLSNPLL